MTVIEQSGVLIRVDQIIAMRKKCAPPELEFYVGTVVKPFYFGYDSERLRDAEYDRIKIQIEGIPCGGGQ